MVRNAYWYMCDSPYNWGWMHLTVKTAVVGTPVFMFWNFKVHFLPSGHPWWGFLVFPKARHSCACTSPSNMPWIFLTRFLLHSSSVKNAVVWDVTPCSLAEIHPYYGRTCYPEFAVNRFLCNNDFLPGYPISHSRAVFSKVTVTITSGHATPSLFLCSVSVKLLSDLWNLYRVIQEERSVFWEMVVSVIVRQRVCMDMFNCDWLLRWSCWNVQI